MDFRMDKKSTSRREFCKRGLLVLSAIPVIARTLDGSPALAQALPTKPVDPAGSQATALGYVHDATKTDLVKFPKRKGAEGEKQFCDNCMFYQQGGLKAEGMDGEWGKCLLFPDGLVAAKGWCNSWSPKPA
jgi:hypothetical protein